MAQFSKGDTFTNGEQVTGARLNQLVDSATLLAGAITDQSSITANTVATGDSILLYDLSATALREANVSDLLGSNLPVTTSAITAGANSDVVITPYDGAAVSGSTYVSADAITVTVTTAVAHGLSVNQVVQIYGAGTGYNGVFKITAVTSLTFTYLLSSIYATGAVITISPTLCSYYTKGTNRVGGHSTVSGNQYASNVVTSYLEVNTQATFNTATFTGASTFTGATVISSTGSLSILGSMTNKSLPFFAVRAFGRYNTRTAPNGALAFTTNPTQTAQGDNAAGIHSAGNIASITRLNAGYVTVVMTTPMPDCNYTVIASAKHNLTIAYGNSLDAVIINPSSFHLIVASGGQGQYDAEVNFTVIA